MRILAARSAQRSRMARAALLATLIVAVSAASASAQYVMFPRIGVSASPDHYQPILELVGEDTFELYVVALPAEDQTTLQQDYGRFHWAVLEACCGGAAAVIETWYNPVYEHEGDPYLGVYSSSEECMNGSIVHLATLSLRMLIDIPGQYYVIGGPLAVARTCEQEDVVLTDLIAYINYQPTVTPTDQTSLSDVKAMFE